MAVAPPPPDLVERFRRDLDALTGERGARLGIAVSGGADSLALLLLAHAARPGEIAAATVDHGLRPESPEEVAFVADLCTRLGVPHAALSSHAPIEGNIQSAARNLRYDLLRSWAVMEGVGMLLTAHHQDDQAETLMMRLRRGAGVGGLAGIRAVARINGIVVGRPLLGWTRAELRAVVDAAGLTPVEDPSNSDPRYDRARLRQHLAEAGWIDGRGLARSAAALADADAALDWVTDRVYDERVRVDGEAASVDPAGLPDELLRRLASRVFAALAPGATLRGADLQRLLVALSDGRTATLAGVKAEGGMVWRFTLAPPRRG